MQMNYSTTATDTLVINKNVPLSIINAAHYIIIINCYSCKFFLVYLSYMYCQPLYVYMYVFAVFS